MHKKRNCTVIVNQTPRKNRTGTRAKEFVDVDVFFLKNPNDDYFHTEQTLLAISLFTDWPFN